MPCLVGAKTGATEFNFLVLRSQTNSRLADLKKFNHSVKKMDFLFIFIFCA